MSKKRSWIPIVLAVIIGVFLIAVVIVGAGIFYIFNHVGIETVSAESAQEQFEAARKPFEHQPPLLVLEGRRVRVNPKEKERTGETGKRIDDIHILAWDPDEDKLVRLRIPFWLVAMKSRGRIRLNSGTIFDDEDVSLDIEELERHGPGLILDAADRHGQRVLIWAQ